MVIGSGDSMLAMVGKPNSTMSGSQPRPAIPGRRQDCQNRMANVARVAARLTAIMAAIGSVNAAMAFRSNT